MSGIFLEAWARPLLVLHACVALAAAGATTHLAIVGVRLARGELQLARLTRIYAQVIGATYVVAFALGLLMYPHYRYVVRGLYLDRYEPWASNLFDIKENLAALGLPLAAALFFVGRKLEPSRERAVVTWVAVSGIAVWLVVVTTAVAGLIVTDVKGV